MSSTTIRMGNILNPEASIRPTVRTKGRMMAIDGNEIVVPRDHDDGGYLDDKFRDKNGEPKELKF